MKQTIRVTINGRLYEEDVEPRLLLSHFLRETIGLTRHPPGALDGGLTGGCFGNSSILGGHSSKANSYYFNTWIRSPELENMLSQLKGSGLSRAGNKTEGWDKPFMKLLTTSAS